MATRKTPEGGHHPEWQPPPALTAVAYSTLLRVFPHSRPALTFSTNMGGP